MEEVDGLDLITTLLGMDPVVMEVVMEKEMEMEEEMAKEKEEKMAL